MIELLKNILQFLANMLTFLVDFVQWCVVKVFVMMFDALLALLSAIPVPDWLTGISGNVADIDPGVLFFVAPLQLSTGLTWVVSAYVLRFLIRRIPVIG